MANDSSNSGQQYFWDSGETQMENVGYYSMPPSNFPPPDFNQPPPNFPPPDFNQPPPSYDVPVTTMPEDKPTNQFMSFHNAPPTYQDNTATKYTDDSYSNQETTECNKNYYQSSFSQSENFSTENFNSSWNSRNIYSDNFNSEWNTNSSSNWSNMQNNTNTSWSEINISQKESQIVFESSQKIKITEWRYSTLESFRSYTSSRKRSKTPENRFRSSRSPRRSRYEDQRDKYKYKRERSSSRDYFYDSGDFKRRCSYRRYGSHVSSSERSYVSSRSRRRSRSSEYRSFKMISPNSSSSIFKLKCPTERELLLEKYR